VQSLGYKKLFFIRSWQFYGLSISSGIFLRSTATSRTLPSITRTNFAWAWEFWKYERPRIFSWMIEPHYPVNKFLLWLFFQIFCLWLSITTFILINLWFNNCQPLKIWLPLLNQDLWICSISAFLSNGWIRRSRPHAFYLWIPSHRLLQELFMKSLTLLVLTNWGGSHQRIKVPVNRAMPLHPWSATCRFRFFNIPY
jgi:hypothetical protein